MPTDRFRRAQGELSGRFLGATRQAGRRGREAEDVYFGRAQAFDPSEAITRYAQGAFGGIQEQLRRQLEDLAGSSVGAGRLDTGFYDVDRGEFLRGGIEDLNRQIAQQSVVGAGMEQRNIEGIGQYGQGVSNRYLDLVAGGLDQARLEEEQRRRRRGGFLSGLGTVAGGVGGFFLGGPAGAAAGARIGGAAGRQLGGGGY